MQIYLVGGAVRDELLGYPSDENDFVVVGSSPEHMLSLGYKSVGQDFPVFLHPKTKDEYALARTERKSGHGYHGFTFDAGATVTLEQDLSRRDLTINAIAKNENGTYVDPYNGRQDINNKTLRHVSVAFREDPVRILRTARFAARYYHLGFRVAANTLSLMGEMVDAGEADHLVAERVWKELAKAMAERNPEIFFHLMQSCNALKAVTPEIQQLLELDEKPFNDKSAIKALRHACTQTENAAIRLAVLLHDIQRVTEKSVSLKDFLRRLTVPKHVAELIQLVAFQYHSRDMAQSLTPQEILTHLKDCDAIRRPQRYQDFLNCCEIYDTATDHATNARIESQANNTFLSTCLDAITKVSAQPFIDKGLDGKALGEAITEARRAKIQELY